MSTSSNTVYIETVISSDVTIPRPDGITETAFIGSLVEQIYCYLPEIPCGWSYTVYETNYRDLSVIVVINSEMDYVRCTYLFVTHSESQRIEKHFESSGGEIDLVWAKMICV